MGSQRVRHDLAAEQQDCHASRATTHVACVASDVEGHTRVREAPLHIEEQPPPSIHTTIPGATEGALLASVLFQL